MRCSCGSTVLRGSAHHSRCGRQAVMVAACGRDHLCPVIPSASVSAMSVKCVSRSTAAGRMMCCRLLGLYHQWGQQYLTHLQGLLRLRSKQASCLFSCALALHVPFTATRFSLRKKPYSSSLKYRHDCGATKSGNLSLSIARHLGCLYFHASLMLNTNAFAHPS